MKAVVSEIKSSNISVVHSRSDSSIVHVGLMIGFGSKDDPFDYLGISHFIEHMWFKGTVSKSSLEIITEIESRGGEINAYTSKEETCIHISILKDYYEIAISLLFDIYENSVFPQKELLKERNVIFDEIESYEDSPAELIYDEFDELLFANTSLSNPILGNKKSLKNIDSTIMHAFYKDVVLQSKLVLSFVGNIPYCDFMCAVNTLFVPTTHAFPIKKADLIIKPNSISPFKIIKKKSTNQSHCVLGCHSYTLYDEERIPMSLLSNIVGGSQFSSILNYSLRELHGLTYNVESVFSPYMQNGSFTVYFGTEKNNVEKCFDVVSKEFKKLCSSGVLEDNIQIYKNQLLGSVALSFENNMQIMISQAKNVLVFNKVESQKYLIKRINSVTGDSLKSIANQVLDFDKMSILMYC